MKPKPAYPCACRRALASSRCEDRDGVKWLCKLCVVAWWSSVHARLASRGIFPVGGA